MTARYRTLLILAAITVFSYLSVDIFYKVVDARLVDLRTEMPLEAQADTPKAAPKASAASYRAILDRNLFGSVSEGQPDVQIDVEKLEPTRLQLSLIGTASGNGDFDYAVIEEKGKKDQGLYRVGDEVSEATVVKILRGKVILRVSGKDEVLSMEEGSTTREGTAQKEPQAGGRIEVSKAEIDTAFQNMNQMLTQVRVRPYFSGGKPDGFMVSRIKRGSIFEKMGLKNGDVIRGVNGQSIESADKMLELYRSMTSGSEVTVDIKRRGKEEELRYVFQ
jgi:general secretion pathway protein C